MGGKALVFHRERAKELLAYLVDRRGSTVNRKELAAVLFEDREYSRATQAYLTQLVDQHLNATPTIILAAKPAPSTVFTGSI